MSEAATAPSRVAASLRGDRESTRQRVPNPWVVGLGAAALFGWLASQRDFGPGGYFVPLKGFLVLMLGLLPTIGYFARVRRNPMSAEPLPYFPLFGVIYGTCYGLPVLVRDQVVFMSLAPNAAAVSDALDVAIAGWCSLWFGFRVLAPRVFVGARGRHLQVPWDENRARSLAVVLIFVGLVAELVADVTALPASLVQVVRLLTLLERLGIGIVLASDLKRGGRGWKRWALWGLIVPFYLFFQIRSGHIGNAIRPLAFLMFVVWAYRFRLPWTVLALVAVGVVLLRGAAEEFRSMMWRSASVAEMSPLERASTYVDIVARDLSTHPEQTLEKAFDLIASRTAQVGLFAHTVHRTPNAIPYWEGETYKTLASSFVPRFIWRDKPTKQLGQRFGHRYAVLHPSDRKTSVNLPQLIELFINFGPFGTCLGMMALGLLYAFAYLKLNSRAAGDGTILIGAVIFSELVNIESDFSLVFGGLLQVAVALWLVLRFVAPKARRGPRRVSHEERSPELGLAGSEA